MKRDEFRQLLREFYSARLNENDISAVASVDPGEISIDNQVDRLLISYESEARKAKNESQDFRLQTRNFLKEADEDAGESEGETPKTKLASEDIDIESFAASVVRLVNNYQSLLDMRDTLLRRAESYINKNYEQQVLSDFKSILRDTFDVEVGVTDVDKQFQIKVPAAVGAGKVES